MEDDYLLNRLPGFPKPSLFKEKYKLIENIHEIDETYIGKEVIILYKYTKKIVGMNYKEFLYKGYLMNPLEKDLDYKNYVWIKDDRIDKHIMLSKSRFYKKNYDLEMYIYDL